MIASLLAFSLMCQAVPLGIEGRGAPAVEIPRIEASVQIDGALDEAPWAQAARLSGFSQYQPSDSRPAEEQTDVLVWYSPEAMHFGIIARDRDPSSVRATVADRDNIDRDDHVTIYLDTFNDRRRAFFFAVNPLGAQQDGVHSEGQFNAGSNFGGSVDKNPDYQFDSRGRLTPEGYVVEVRIPFKSLRYQGNGPQTWGVNVKRKIQRTGYEDTWTDAKRAASFLAQAGTIRGLHDLRRGVVFEAQPFVTGAADGTRRSSGDFGRNGADVSAGANLRLGWTNLSLDATFNPDFSQVESDAGLITVNERFALFFPEKRPFFLEGIELFSTPGQLVYTRRVVNPIAGGKVTGKFGPFGVAHLTAVDDTGSDNALFNVTRLRRDFGRNSVAGVTYTDRVESGAFNRVLAADARIVFAKLYYVLLQGGGSWTGHEGEATRAAPTWTAEVDRTGRRWGFNYKLTGIGDGFDSQAGFVPRSNIVEARAFNRLTYYGRRGARVESVSAFFGPERLWRHDEFGTGSPTEGGENVNVMVNLRGGWFLQQRFSRDFVRFERRDYENYTVFGPVMLPYDAPERMDNALGTSSSVATPTWQKINARFEYVRMQVPIFPEASEGRETRMTATVGARPTASTRVDLNTVTSVLRRARDDSEFARTILPRLKVEYQPSRSLFFRVVGEYRAQRRASLEDARSGLPLFIRGIASAVEETNGLRVDWLASYEPTPGTAVYLGYGSALDSTRWFSVQDLRRVNDGFFVKLAYQIRR